MPLLGILLDVWGSALMGDGCHALLEEDATLDGGFGEDTLGCFAEGIDKSIVSDAESFAGAVFIVVRTFSLRELEWGHVSLEG